MARYHEPPHEPRLSPAIEAALAISFRNEVAELRLLSGLALPSLGP